MLPAIYTNSSSCPPKHKRLYIRTHTSLSPAVFSSHPTPATLHIRNILGTLEVSHHPPHHTNSPLQSTEHSSPPRRNILILRRSAFLDQPHSQELRFASHIKDVFHHYGLHRHCGNHCQRRIHQYLVDAFQRVCLDSKHLSCRISMDS